MSQQEYLPEDVRLRVLMKGIQLDVRADGVNNELAMDLIEQCLEVTENRLKDSREKNEDGDN